jgi:hypothetical protein
VSIRAINRAWENSAAQGSDLLVLLALADFADERGKAWPSNATLARKARVCERQVRMSIAVLSDQLKEIDVSYNTGPHGVNEYHVLCFGDPDKFAPWNNLPGGKLFRGQTMSLNLPPIHQDPSGDWNRHWWLPPLTRRFLRKKMFWQKGRHIPATWP